MIEVEGIQRNDSFKTVYPINGYETCDYRNPKESFSGQFCFWGYKNPLDMIQCEHYKGVIKKIVKDKDGKDEEKTFIQCGRR